MPRRRLSAPRFRQELSWVSTEPDPQKCSCRNHRCCRGTGHAAGECTSYPTTKFWGFRWEYFCAACREYEWAGSKMDSTPIMNETV